MLNHSEHIFLIKKWVRSQTKEKNNPIVLYILSLRKNLKSRQDSYWNIGFHQPPSINHLFLSLLKNPKDDKNLFHDSQLFPSDPQPGNFNAAKNN